MSGNCTGAAMTHPGNDPHAPGHQPGTPEGAWTPPAAPQTPPQGAPIEQPQKTGAKKWLPIAGSVAVAGVLGAGSLTGWFGLGDPKVGDCVQMKGDTDFDVIDCSADEAEYKIVGIQDEEMTWPDFEAASVDDVCRDFDTWEVALWIGELETEPGTIYCSEPV
jgi:hypothetical protein